jgi:hypothetical protein
MQLRTLTRAVVLAVAVAAFAACTPHRWPPSPDSPGPHYYVAMGDSLSTGTQPPYTEENNFGDTDEGYTNQLFAKLRQQDTKLEMVELGCGGETAVSMIHGDLPGVGSCGPPQAYDFWYPHGGTQLAEAEHFLRTHRGETRVLTIDIGGNDAQNANCAANADPAACNARLNLDLRRNLSHILMRLRLADPQVLIVGMTYYNPWNALWLSGQHEQAAASAPVTRAFNDVLSTTFTNAGARVADVGAAFATYDFTTIVDTPFGSVPIAVARVCQWTWTCAPPPVGPDVHGNTEGYGVMADVFYDAINAPD